MRDGQIFLRRPSGDVVQLTRTPAGTINAEPAWSPDGGRLAFASDRDGSRSIYVMNADGTGVERRTTGTGDGYPSWHPDGQRIVFEHLSDGGWGLYAVAAGGPDTIPTTLLNRQGYEIHPSISPDGRWVAFVSDIRIHDTFQDLFRVAISDPTAIVPILEAPLMTSPPQHAQAARSPDGQRIAVVECGTSSYRTACNGPDTDLAVVAPEGSPAAAFVWVGRPARPSWSPDGSRLVHASRQCPGVSPCLRIFRLVDGADAFLLENAGEPAWRPR